MDSNVPSDTLGIDQIEKLVLSLYEPSEPQAIAAAQATLTLLQTSPRAWSIARDLLSRTDEKVKFHGALIIIIKLNTEGSSLTENDASELLMKLVGWYLDSIFIEKSSLVTRKLASALATFLLHHHKLWPRYIAHLVTCVSLGQLHHPLALEEPRDLSQVLDRLDDKLLQAILWVVENVVELAMKTELKAVENIGFYRTIVASTPDAVALMSRAMSPQVMNLQTYEDSIKCLKPWLDFATTEADASVSNQLSPLLSIIIDAAPRFPTDSITELLVDVVKSSPTAFTREHRENVVNLLASPWAQEHHQRLMRGEFELGSLLYGQLLFDVGETKMRDLMEGRNTYSRELLLSMCSLLSAKGYPGVEDEIFVQGVEFWSVFAETLKDYMPSSSDDGSTSNVEKRHEPWIEPAVSYVVQAVSNAWPKMSSPPDDEYSQWDKADRAAFRHARRETGDLLLSAYSIIGPRMVFTFSDLLLEALAERNWQRLDATVFCFVAILRHTTSDDRTEDAVISVISSPLISTVQGASSTIHYRGLRACVKLIRATAKYFDRKPDLLPGTFNLLFELIYQPRLAACVSEAIRSLLVGCAERLSSELGVFLDECQKFAASQDHECRTVENLIGGIAAVASHIPDIRQRYAIFGRLLTFVEKDVMQSIQMVESPQLQSLSCRQACSCFEGSEGESPALHTGKKALRCLFTLSMGAAHRRPVDNFLPGSDKKPEPELSEIHQRVYGILLGVRSAFPTSLDVISLITGFFCGGFCDPEPDPFVLPPRHVYQYLTAQGISSTGISRHVIMATSFTSSLRQDYDDFPDKESMISSLLLWVVETIRQLPDPESDPDLSESAIDFVTHLIKGGPHILLQLQPFAPAEYFFLFTLKVLDGKEPLPKASAGNFWATFIDLKYTVPEQQKASNAIMDTLGPLLCQSLARNIGGNASRSDIDRLSQPVRRLIATYPSAKAWLEAGFDHPSFPSSKVTREEKLLFIKKLISLRGSTNTTHVVKSFWLAAKGSKFAYAS